MRELIKNRLELCIFRKLYLFCQKRGYNGNILSHLYNSLPTYRIVWNILKISKWVGLANDNLSCKTWYCQKRVAIISELFGIS